jgi:hypothetical protein
MFVVELVGLQAVVKMADELVEPVRLGLVVPVSGGAAGVVVAAGSWRGQRSQCPDRADRGESPAVDMAVQHNGFLAACAADWCRSGEGFEPSGVGEASSIVADLGRHRGAGQVPQVPTGHVPR